MPFIIKKITEIMSGLRTW